MQKLVVGTTQFLLWKVNKQNLWEHVLDEMFHAALNLSHRLAYERERQNVEVWQTTFLVSFYFQPMSTYMHCLYFLLAMPFYFLLDSSAKK